VPDSDNNNTRTMLWCCHHDSRVIARVHPVHVMNAEQRLMAASCLPLDQRTWAVGPPVGCYETTFTIAIYYYSARKLILILLSHRW